MPSETTASVPPQTAQGRFPLLRTFAANNTDNRLMALSGTTVMSGLAVAMLSGTISLYLADAVRATPLMVGLFFFGRSVLEGSTDLIVGQISDRIGNRRTLLALCSFLSAIGAVCYMELRNYYEVFICGVIFFGIGGSYFAQLLAYTREMAEKSAIAADSLNSAMRSLNSMTWIFGPPLGFWLLQSHGYTGMFIPVGILYSLAGALSLWRLPNLSVRRHQSPGPRNPFRGLSRQAKTLMAITVLLLTAISIYQIDISLAVTRALHINASFVGLLLGLAAALEIPVMIFIAGRAERFGPWRLLLAAALCSTLFFCLLPLATTKPELLLLQVPNAFWVSLTLCIPVTIMQDSVGGGRGMASSLYSSSFKAGIMIGGATVGIVTEWAGYIDVFWVCGALSATAACILLPRAGSKCPRTQKEEQC